MKNKQPKAKKKLFSKQKVFQGNDNTMLSLEVNYTSDAEEKNKTMRKQKHSKCHGILPSDSESSGSDESTFTKSHSSQNDGKLFVRGLSFSRIRTSHESSLND